MQNPNSAYYCLVSAGEAIESPVVTVTNRTVAEEILHDSTPYLPPIERKLNTVLCCHRDLPNINPPLNIRYMKVACNIST